MSRSTLFLEDCLKGKSTVVQQTAHAAGGQVESKQFLSNRLKRVSDSNDGYLQPAKRTLLDLSDQIEDVKPIGRQKNQTDQKVASKKYRQKKSEKSANLVAELQKEESKNKELKSIHDDLENAIRSLTRVLTTQTQISSSDDIIKALKLNGLELTSKFIADELQAPIQAVTTTVTTVVDDVVTPVSEVITLYVEPEAQPEFTIPEVVVQPELVIQSTPVYDDDDDCEPNNFQELFMSADEYERIFIQRANCINSYIENIDFSNNLDNIDFSVLLSDEIQTTN